MGRVGSEPQSRPRFVPYNSSSRVTYDPDFVPEWPGQQPSPVRDFMPQYRLGEEYACDPWPTLDKLKELARQLNIPVERVYQWFAERRAIAVGLRSGVIDTIPDPQEFPTYRSWRVYVSQFGTEEYRANALKDLQNPAKYLSDHPSWRKWFAPPVKQSVAGPKGEWGSPGKRGWLPVSPSASARLLAGPTVQDYWERHQRDCQRDREREREREEKRSKAS